MNNAENSLNGRRLDGDIMSRGMVLRRVGIAVDVSLNKKEGDYRDGKENKRTSPFIVLVGDGGS